MTATKVDRDFIFLQFASTEGRRALDALDEIDRLASVREQVAPGFERRESQSIFNAIRLALHFGASVSKVYWPDPRSSTARARGERLRGLAELDREHPLARRKLRNHVEHLDERLDDWTAESPRPFTHTEFVIYADWKNIRKDELIESTTIIYDEGAKAVRLFGETFLLADLRAAIEDVMSHTSIGINKIVGSWKDV